MPIVPIHSLTDPELAPYRVSRDRDLACDLNRFIAEGIELIQRMSRCHFRIESILCVEKKIPLLDSLAHENLPIFCVPNEFAPAVFGRGYKTGIYACGMLPSPRSLQAYLAAKLDLAHGLESLVILPNTTNPQNMGAICRTCTGFGINTLLLGPHCTHPLYRRSLRCSMGEALCLEILNAEDLIQDLHKLKHHGYHIVAGVLNPRATSLYEITNQMRPAPIALLIGNEKHGLAPEISALADQLVRIPMHNGTDSLNVNVATGLLLYELMRPNSTPRG
jgi:tRNA G18 (ribose-2'-O)-methylase SpoU